MKKSELSKPTKLSVRVALLTTALLLGAAASTAHAGYFNIYGGYVPTCVPGYWAYGPLGRFWVPAVCG